MTVQEREQLREVLIDYLQLLTSGSTQYPSQGYDVNNKKIAQVRLLLREVA